MKDLTFERLVEPAKSVLIVVLLATSLALSARLWLSPAAASPVREGYRVPYTAPGAAAELDWRDVLQPLSLLLFLPGRDPSYVDPGEQHGLFLWLATRDVAAALPDEALEPVAAGDVERWRQQVLRGGGLGVEAALPSGVRLGLWRQLWSAAAEAAAGSAPGGAAGGTAGDAAGAGDEHPTDVPVDRVVILFTDEGARVLFRAQRDYLGALVTGRGTGGAAGYLDSVRQVLNLIANLDLDQQPAEPVEPAEGLAVAPGVYAPAGGRELPLLQYGPASLPWERLARSFFGSATVPRRVAAGDVVLYTDGQGSLTIRPDEGLAEYQALPAPGGPAGAAGPAGMAAQAGAEGAAPTPAEALAAAVAFGAERGGWPAAGDVVLASVTPVVARGSLSAPRILGYRFGFLQRVDGYLLADRYLAVVEVGPGGVAYWRRRFIESNLADPLGTVAIPIMPAGEAVALAAALGFDELPESARLVDAARLVYVRHEGEFQKPAWQLNLHDGTVVWVSAWPGGDIQVNAAAR